LGSGPDPASRTLPDAHGEQHCIRAFGCSSIGRGQMIGVDLVITGIDVDNQILAGMVALDKRSNL